MACIALCNALVKLMVLFKRRPETENLTAMKEKFDTQNCLMITFKIGGAKNGSLDENADSFKKTIN